MSDSYTQILEIKNQRGLHARAAAKFVKTVAEFEEAQITVSRSGQSVSGNSIMGLLMLAAAIGTTIEVTSEGPQAQVALDAVASLVNDKFGEE